MDFFSVIYKTLLWGTRQFSDAGRSQDTAAGVTAGLVPCSHKVTACPCQITLGPVFSCMTVCSRKSSRSYNCKILWFSGEWEEEEGRIEERETEHREHVQWRLRREGGVEWRDKVESAAGGPAILFSRWAADSLSLLFILVLWKFINH